MTIDKKVNELTSKYFNYNLSNMRKYDYDFSTYTKSYTGYQLATDEKTKSKYEAEVRNEIKNFKMLYKK